MVGVAGLGRMGEVVSESKGFKLLVDSKMTVLKHCIINVYAPFIIYNYLPSKIKYQFICGEKKTLTK
jgi:hypothetical protein